MSDFALPDTHLRGDNRRNALIRFAEHLNTIQAKIGFKVSARGWCYQLEQYRLINKDEFDKVENIINTCRKEGMLPIDFTADEEGRKFANIVTPDPGTIIEHMEWSLNQALDCGDSYIPEYWEDEEYYIQMVVEKIDLKTLFQPVCKQYRIPIATSKGWGSMLMRGNYARRFKEAEDDGLECVLLYCGDKDPDGDRISEFLRSNLHDIENIHWSDGEDGYDPSNLIIDRFGLNFDFIENNNLSWIDNLITGSGKNLASPSHKNHYMDYVQEYLREVGVRKCEANALVVQPEQGRELCKQAIEQYLGENAHQRFSRKKQAVYDTLSDIKEKFDIETKIKDIIAEIQADMEEEE